jgi:hypothetical protein
VAALITADPVGTPSSLMATLQAVEEALEADLQDETKMVSDKHWIKKEIFVQPKAASRAASALGVVLGRDARVGRGSDDDISSMILPPRPVAETSFADAERLFTMTGGHHVHGVGQRPKTPSVAMKTPSLLTTSAAVRARLAKSYVTLPENKAETIKTSQHTARGGNRSSYRSTTSLASVTLSSTQPTARNLSTRELFPPPSSSAASLAPIGTARAPIRSSASTTSVLSVPAPVLTVAPKFVRHSKAPMLSPLLIAYPNSKTSF